MNHILSDIKLPATIKVGKKQVKIPVIEEMTLDQKIGVCKITSTDEEEIEQEVMAVFFGADSCQVSESDSWIKPVFCAKVLDQIIEWNKAEAEKLKYTPTDEEERAGFHKFQVFGEFAVYDAIAKRLHKSHKEVGEMEYTLVFAMMWKDLMDYEFQKKLNDIYAEKNRLKNGNR